MADRHAIYKHAAKEIAWAAGHAVTFMAKWDERYAGSSCHIHMSLWDADAKEALFDRMRDSRGKRLLSGGMRAQSVRFASVLLATLACCCARVQRLRGASKNAVLRHGHDEFTHRGPVPELLATPLRHA